MSELHSRHSHSVIRAILFRLSIRGKMNSVLIKAEKVETGGVGGDLSGWWDGDAVFQTPTIWLLSVNLIIWRGRKVLGMSTGALLYFFFFFRTGTFSLMSALIECQSDGELSGAADRSVFPIARHPRGKELDGGVWNEAAKSERRTG